MYLNYDCLVGKRFNRLVVLKRVESSKSGGSKWLCICDCGNEKEVEACHLKRGVTKSCGCYNKEMVKKRSTKHGNIKYSKRSPTYSSWQSMKQRCYYKKSISYKYYGERGITVCDDWINSFEKFLEDMEERPEGTSLGRIDNNKGYSKYNCRWETNKEQGRNRRNIIYVTINGEKFSSKEAWVKLGVKNCYETFRKGLKKNCQHDDEF